MHLLGSVLSHAKVEDESSKYSLDELKPSDLQNLCIFFPQGQVNVCLIYLSLFFFNKFFITPSSSSFDRLPRHLFNLARQVMQVLSRSHETHRDFFIQKLSEMARTLINDVSVTYWKILDLLDLLIKKRRPCEAEPGSTTCLEVSV